ncbi:MAG: outer membrane beta-barrel protein, partial [Desulfobacteraceae bacterium]
INGNYPISNTNLILFGTIAYGFLSVDIDAHLEVSNSLESYSDSADSKQDYDGYAMEFGASYYFENFPKLSLTAGYKYQKYTNTDDSDDYISFRGLTFGANYRF